MARLRGPDGCPWDREQTHQSIRHNLIEECYEALEALDAHDQQAFKEELGDVLLQVVFHAQMASEKGAFDFDAVAAAISDKLVHRHPHVFGRCKLKTSAEVLQQWEMNKKAEKNSHSILDELPRHLPALIKADKVQRKVARVGFDWKRSEDVLAKIEEELGELKRAMASGRRKPFEEELGDLLFAVVNLARFKGVQAEDLLNRSIDKFIGRFQRVEREVHGRGKRLDQCSLEELDQIWDTVKRRRASTKRTRAGSQER
jgi:tetrapyrrole methylase family protein/MazG family protein